MLVQEKFQRWGGFRWKQLYEDVSQKSSLQCSCVKMSKCVYEALPSGEVRKSCLLPRMSSGNGESDGSSENQQGSNHESFSSYAVESDLGPLLNLAQRDQPKLPTLDWKGRFGQRWWPGHRIFLVINSFNLSSR